MNATILATAILSSYVLVMYISPQDRPDGSYLQNRNNPSVMRRRMLKISGMTAVDLLVVYIYLKLYRVEAPFKLMGIAIEINTETLRKMINTLILFVLLFIGPLSNQIFIEKVNPLTDFYQEVSTIQGFRNYIFGPISEEIVYRACCLAVYSPIVSDWHSVIVYSPLLFAVAHLNHGWDLYLSGQYQITQIAMSLLLQMSYTWLFGVLANKILVSQENIYSCILVHSFCNYMGLPDITPQGPKWWKFCYWSLLCLGVYTFVLLKWGNF